MIYTPQMVAAISLAIVCFLPSEIMLKLQLAGSVIAVPPIIATFTFLNVYLWVGERGNHTR